MLDDSRARQWLDPINRFGLLLRPECDRGWRREVLEALRVSVYPRLPGKRLELLKDVVSKLGRVAVFATSTSPSTAPLSKETELAAGAFGVQLQYVDVLSPKDIETAFQAAGKGRAEAVLVMGEASSILSESRLWTSR